jgi:phage-related protein
MSGTRLGRPLFWVGSSRKDLREFPEPVKDVIGHALFVAQLGGRHEDAKLLRGFGGEQVYPNLSKTSTPTPTGPFTP